MLEKRKLWKLMRLFDKREQSKVSYWLKGELRGHHGATYQLFELMCDPEVSIEQIWASLYPHKALPERPFYDSGFRRLEHSLSGLLETYIAIQAFRKDEESMDLFLLRELDLLQAKGLFEAKYKKVKKKLEEQPVRDGTYHRKLYRLMWIRIPFVLKHDMANYGKALYEMIIQQNLAIKHERLRSAVIIKSYLASSRNKSQREIISVLYESPEAWLTDEEINNDPVLYIRYQSILYLNGEVSLEGFEKELRGKIHLFRYDFQADMYYLFLNSYMRRTFQGERKITHSKLLEILEWGLEDRFVFQEGILSEVFYRTLINMCCRTLQLELGEYYLQNLKQHLIVEVREEAYIYCKGMLRMAQERHLEAIKYLNRKFSHPPLDLRARKIVLMLKYDQGERVSLENEIRALASCIERSTYLNLEIKTEAKLE
ncbi:MAG: hypothetical protein AAFQ92_27985, partial [Bacteroidota bacterium]